MPTPYAYSTLRGKQWFKENRGSVPSGGAVPYATYAAAQAAIVPASDTFLITLGYYTAGDGGGTLYTKVTSGTVHLTTADGAQWAVTNNPLSPKMFGAKGDGVTNDQAAIQAAVTRASIYASGQGATVYIQAGNYKITSSIVVPTHMTIIGDGMLSTTITLGNTSQIGFHVTSQNAVTIRDLAIVAGGAQVAGSAILLSNGTASGSNYHVLEGVRCAGVYDGVHVDDASFFKIIRCHFESFTNIGVEVQQVANVGAGDNTIYGSVFISSIGGGQTGIYWKSGSGLRIENTKILNGSYGIHLQAQTGGLPGAGAISDLMVIGNSIEGQISACIFLEQIDTTALYDVQINDNEFGVILNGIVVVANVGATWIFNMQINCNTFTYTAPSAGSAIDLNGPQSVTVGLNTINGTGVAVANGLVVRAFTDSGKSTSNTALIGVTTPFLNIGATAWTDI